MNKIRALLLLNLSLILGSSALADDLDIRILPLFQRFYPPGQLAQLTDPDYELRSANLNWSPSNPSEQPQLILGYHRALPFVKHGVTLHFSALVRHEPQSKVVKPHFRCQKDYQQQRVKHPQLGDYILCTKQLLSKPDRKFAHAGNLSHVTAQAWPMVGNRLPHITLSLHGLAEDILPLLLSLKI